MKHRSNTHPTVKYSQMNSVPKLFSCCYADCWTENHFSTEFCVLTPNHTHSHTLFWGCVSRWFGRALAWHARGQRFDPAILHQKSTVFRRKHGAFLFAESRFLGLHCFACTVFRLLQAVELRPPRFRAIQQKRGIFVWVQHRRKRLSFSFLNDLIRSQWAGWAGR